MPDNRILVGDCREVLATLPERSLHCVVTSPPYWAQRVYSGVDVVTSIGNEPTPEEWCANLVDVFRAVKRVLRDDGTLWLNVGDKYSGSGGAGGDYNEGGLKAGANGTGPSTSQHIALPPKNLLGLPWRLAFGLQADGWILRSEIVWHKTSAMPESVQDRPSRAHEQIFLLSKGRMYFYDSQAVRQEGKERGWAGSKFNDGATAVVHPNIGKGERTEIAGSALRDVWTLSAEPFSASKIEGYAGPAAAEHYAVFPPSLPERCIKAGTSERGVCGECGAPWQMTRPFVGSYHDHSADGIEMGLRQRGKGPKSSNYAVPEEIGWTASCSHDAPAVPATVLDPFLGSGTTLMVANRLGRNGIGIELSPQYAELARQRIKADAPLLAP